MTALAVSLSEPFLNRPQRANARPIGESLSAVSALQGAPQDSSSHWSKQVIGHSSSSYAQEHGTGDDRMASPVSGRTSEHYAAQLNDERTLAKQVSAALVVDFSQYRSTHKTIAQKAGVSPETVKRWLAADSAPSLIYFMRLLPHSPSLRKLVAMDAELDPQFQRELSALIQRLMQR